MAGGVRDVDDRRGARVDDHRPGQTDVERIGDEFQITTGDGAARDTNGRGGNPSVDLRTYYGPIERTRFDLIRCSSTASVHDGVL